MLCSSINWWTTRVRWGRALWYSDVFPRMAQQQVGERHWCTIPHTSLSSTGVVKSVDDLTSADLWHYQPVCDLRLYKCDIVVVDTWTHETVPATVFRDLPDSRYPMQLNHAVSTNSVSHSKIKPLCKLIFCFHYVERHLHINGKLSIFATFAFAPWKRKMYLFTHA